MRIMIWIILSLLLSACASVSSPGNGNGSKNNQTMISTLPQSQPMVSSPPPAKIDRIALLLPLTGPVAQQADAIRNGFITAYYRAREKDTQDNASIPQVKIYNTANQDINQVYQQAVAAGADFVVGPLLKPNLQSLISNTKLTVPTLALNTIPLSKPIHNLYLFGLSPFDEAQQAAIKAWQDHHSHALIIAPTNQWGENVAEVFRQQWQMLGGNVVAEVNYSNQQDLATKIQDALHLNQSYQRMKQLRGILYEHMRFTPRRRKDVDVVFLVANPQTARMVRPLLRYYYASNIPVYSTSQIYSGSPNAQRDHDLDGIKFCDMPWILEPGKMQPAYLDKLQSQVKTLWPQSYQRYTRLYALGVDAFDILPQLNNMSLAPQLSNNGATGTLYLDQIHHVFRKLIWSKMIDGKPQALS